MTAGAVSATHRGQLRDVSFVDVVAVLLLDGSVAWLGTTVFPLEGSAHALLVLTVMAFTTLGYLGLRGLLPLTGMSPATLTGWAAALAMSAAVVLQAAHWGVIAFDRLAGGWTHPYVPWWAVPRSLADVGWLAIVATTVAAPIVEELVFRGVVYPGFRKHLGVGWAVTLSAIVFAGVHPGGGLLFVMLLGVVTAVVYEKTSSLWAAITAHATFNAFVMVAGVLLYTIGDVPGATMR